MLLAPVLNGWRERCRTFVRPTATEWYARTCWLVSDRTRSRAMASIRSKGRSEDGEPRRLRRLEKNDAPCKWDSPWQRQSMPIVRGGA